MSCHDGALLSTCQLFQVEDLWKKRDKIAIQSVKTMIRMTTSSIFMEEMLEGSFSFPSPLEQLRKLTAISMAFYFD